MSDLKGKVAVVTGASKGIGAAIAKNLSAAGATLVVNYSSSKESADRVVADIESNGGVAIAVKGDVAKAADVRRLFAETKRAFGKLDVLVNNAGIYKFLPLEETTEDEFHRQFLRLAVSRPRVRTTPASRTAISRRRWLRVRRLVGLDSQRTLRASLSFLLRTIPRGLPASDSQHREVTGNAAEAMSH